MLKKVQVIKILIFKIYKAKEYKDFNKEYMKWICEELDIEKDYVWIMEQYEFCKKTINEYFEVKKDEESTIK